MASVLNATLCPHSDLLISGPQIPYLLKKGGGLLFMSESLPRLRVSWSQDARELVVVFMSDGVHE